MTEHGWNVNVILTKKDKLSTKSNSIKDGRNCLVVTQDTIIKNIADKEDINVATVRQIFKSAEDVIFDYLSSTPPSENIKIKLFNGISLKRKHIDSYTYQKGMFGNLECDEHVRITSKVTRYLNDKVNESLSYNP